MEMLYRHWFSTLLVSTKVQIIVEEFKLNGTHHYVFEINLLCEKVNIICRTREYSDTSANEWPC